MRRFLKTLLLVAAACGVGVPVRAAPVPDFCRWMVYYGAAWDAAWAGAYDVAILNSENAAAIAGFHKTGGTVLGYLSVGEVNEASPAFVAAKAAGVLIEENPDWKGAWRVDVRSPAWKKILVRTVAQTAWARGVDGFFLDTLDVASYLENDKKMPGSMKAARDLVRALKARFPRAILIANNGLFLADLAPVLSAWVVEDVFTMYDFKTKRYGMAGAVWSAQRVADLQAFAKRTGRPLLALDYWDPADTVRVSEIAARIREAGFFPYIADIGLATVTFRPECRAKTQYPISNNQHPMSMSCPDIG